MRSTLIFRGIPESEQSNTRKDVFKNLVNPLTDKLDLDHCELKLQLSRTRCTLTSDFDKGYKPIYAQFFN